MRAEDHLRDNPDDGRGWDVLAPVYFRLGEVGKSETAYRNAIRLLGETPQRLSGLGETMVTAAGGIVTADALTFDGKNMLTLSARQRRQIVGRQLVCRHAGLPGRPAPAGTTPAPTGRQTPAGRTPAPPG